MFLFLGENLFKYTTRRCIFSAKIINCFMITHYRNTFSNKILTEHINKSIALTIFSVAAFAQRVGIKIRFATKLLDTFSKFHSMSLFLVGVLKKFRCDTIAMYP